MKATVEITPQSRCPNCGYEGTAPFCGECGQSQIQSHSVGHWLSDVFREIVSADSRFWLTVGLLIFKPGRLEMDWIDGRRKRYMSPTRIYLFSAAIFFFTLTMVPTQNSVISEIAGGLAVSWEGLISTSDETVTSDDIADQVFSVTEMSMKWILMLGMVPALAAFTKVFLGRRGDFFASHLVASLHAHSVMYFCMVVLLALLAITGHAADVDASTKMGLVSVLPVILVYFLAQSHRVYGRGWGSTLVRVCGVVLAYQFVLVAVSIALSVVAGITA